MNLNPEPNLTPFSVDQGNPPAAAISEQQAEQLIAQTQAAHRLAAGFYERLLPQIQALARCCDARFDSWGPKHMQRTKKATNPASQWPWELLPMFSSWHLYLRSNGPQAQPADLHLLVRIYLEDSFQPEPQQGPKRQRPDPLQMPAGQAIVEIELYACKQAADQSLADLVQHTKQATHGPAHQPRREQRWIEVNPALDFWGITVPMARFISDFEHTQNLLERAVAQFTLSQPGLGGQLAAAP